MYKLFVSWRYLRKKKIALLPILAVAIVVMAMVVVLSVMAGFDRELRKRIRGSLSHIIIEQRYDILGFDDYEAVMKRVGDVEHVEACAPFVEGLMLLRMRGYYRWSQFRGVDPVLESEVSNFKNYIGNKVHMKSGMGKQHGKRPVYEVDTGREANFLLPDGTDPGTKTPGVMVGIDLAHLVDSGYGDERRYLESGENLVGVTISGFGGYRVKKFTLVGYYKSGYYDYDNQIVYMDLKTAQKFRDTKNTVSGISVKLDNYRNADKAKKLIEEALEDYEGIGILEVSSYSVQTWEDKRAIFLTAVKIERRVMAIILLFMVLVAGLNILSVTGMAVVEKTKEIGILRALGATKRGIMNIFLMTGLLMGVIGAGLGLLLGLAITLNVNRLEDLIYRVANVRVFPAEIYAMDKIPTYISPIGVVAICGSAALLCFLCSILPAMWAAKLDPAEAVRYE